jgi:hypothetical protein
MSELLRMCLVLKIVLLLSWFPIWLNISETPLHIWDIHRAKRLFLIVWITAKAKDHVSSYQYHLTDLVTLDIMEDLLWIFWIKLFFACSEWLELKLRYQSGLVFYKLGSQCCHFPDYQNVQKRNYSMWFSFHSELGGRPLTVRWLRKFCDCFGPWGQITKVSLTYWSHSDSLCCTELTTISSKCS